MKLYSRDRARRSFFDTLAYRALSQIGTILSYAVLVRSMSEEAFGVLNLLYAVIPIINTLGSLGLDHVLRRFQPEYLRAGRVAAASWLLRVVRRLRFASNLVLIGIIILGWHWVAPWFELSAYRVDFAIFSVLMLIHFQVIILQYAMSSHMLHQYSVGSVAILSAGKLISYLSLAALGMLSLRNAILADLVSYALSYLFLSRGNRIHQHVFASTETYRPEQEEKQRLKRYAGYSHFNDAASILQYSETDRFFVAALINPVIVGTYAFYTRLAEMATSLIPQRLFDNLVQPLFFGVPADEAHEKLPRYFSFLINMSLLYQLPMITFTAIFHADIVRLVFGETYVDHSFLLPLVIAFTTTDYVFSVPIHLLAQYKERTAIILKSQLVGIYQVAAMLVLVPMLGLLGAALASGTFHIFRNLIVWSRVREEGVWINWRSAILAMAVIWGAAAWLCSLARDLSDLPVLVEMSIGGVICVVALLIYTHSPGITESDRIILSNVLSGREGKALRWFGLLPSQQAGEQS